MIPRCVDCRGVADPLAICRGCRRSLCDDCATPHGDRCRRCRRLGVTGRDPTLADVVAALEGRNVDSPQGEQ